MSRPIRLAPTAITLLAAGALLSQPASGDSQVRQLVGNWKVEHVASGPAMLRVFVAGDGPTVVMLPGRGMGPSALEPLAQRLVEAGYRVVLPEPRGYGESVGPLDNVTLHDLALDIARTIETVGGEPVVVIGHAFGNRVGRMLAQDRADLIRGVVLIAAGGRFPPTRDVADKLQTWLDKTLPADRRIAAAKAAFFGPQSDPTTDDLMLDGVSADTSKMQASASGPLETWWPGGRSPMLVVQGLADVDAPPENGRSLKMDYPERVTLVEFPGLGHFMLRERPDLIANAVIAFMRMITPHGASQR